MRTFAQDRAITIIEAVVEPGEPSAIAQVMLGSEQVLATLDAAAPAILYLVAMPFSVEQLAMEAASDLGLAAEALPAPLAAQCASSASAMAKSAGFACSSLSAPPALGLCVGTLARSVRRCSRNCRG